MTDLRQLPFPVLNRSEQGLGDLAILFPNSGCRLWGVRQHGGGLTHRFKKRRIKITHPLLVGHRLMGARYCQGFEKTLLMRPDAVRLMTQATVEQKKRGFHYLLLV